MRGVASDRRGYCAVHFVVLVVVCCHQKRRRRCIHRKCCLGGYFVREERAALCHVHWHRQRYGQIADSHQRKCDRLAFFYRGRVGR